MCKELWIENYERELENIVYEFDIEFDEAELKLKAMFENDPSYLDDYSNLYYGE